VSETTSLFLLKPALSRPDTLDPALLRPGRLDRRVEFSLPDAEGRAHILRIHARRCVVV
jgi:26S proteasome regulatory subunit T1